MATNPPVTIPLSQAFLPKWLLGFADNEFQNIVERTYRDFATDIDSTFVSYDKLTTNLVRGSVFRVPYVTIVNGLLSVDISQVPQRLRIQGMELLAVNGVTAGDALAGLHADSISFRLLAYPTGTIDALVDEKPTTTATVKARIIRTSGTDAQKQAYFAPLILEDHDYLKGEVATYEFPDGETRLVQWRADSTGFTHPTPTGLDSDPIYAIFAPAASGITRAEMDALTARVKDLEVNGTGNGGTDVDALPAPEVNGLRTVTEAFLLDVVARLAHGRGFSGPNTGASDRMHLRGWWELLAYGADADYYAFVASSAYAIMRRDATEQLVQAYVQDTLVALALRATHATVNGLRTTGPLVFSGNRPGQLSASAIDNIATLSVQVNYRDPARDSIWINGTVHSSTGSSDAAMAALFALVADDVDAIPDAALAIAGEILIRTNPIDPTISSSFFLEGFAAGLYSGQSRAFRQGYSGPPIGNLFGNSQFTNSNEYWTAGAGWTYGNGQAATVNGNASNSPLYAQPFLAAGRYRATVGVKELNQPFFNFSVQSPVGTEVSSSYINSTGDFTVDFTLVNGQAQFAVFSAQSVVLEHMYLVALEE